VDVLESRPMDGSDTSGTETLGSAVVDCLLKQLLGSE
jgi:hypothetical protein